MSEQKEQPQGEVAASEGNSDLMDYKIFNFNGEPYFIEVDFDRFSNHGRNVYSTDWELMDLQIQYPRNPHREINKPKHLAEMLRFARVLSAGVPFLRTDFYIVNDQIYFGEMTFFHGGGMERFEPSSVEAELGDKIVLPTSIN